MLDKERNGRRTHHQIMEHLTEYALVLWAWNSGVNAEGIPRETLPVPKAEYIEVVKKWFENGAVIPE
ncbi:MAG: rhamnogalacturonyl hydrolase YesR [Saprospiraceae bacterium]|jgi:rhamnogalacturonyl hydrolase YesR